MGSVGSAMLESGMTSDQAADLFHHVGRTSLGSIQLFDERLEYQTRLGAAIDISGISESVACELLQAGRLKVLIAAATDRLDAAAAEAPFIRELHRKHAQQVKDGERTPESLILFTREAVAGSIRSAPQYTPEELDGEGGW